MHEGFVAKAVERIGVARRGDNPGAADQAPSVSVFEDEEIALFAVETDFGGKRGLRAGDFLAQALGIVGQGRDTHRAVRSQALHLGQVCDLRRTHHQHGVTPFE